MKKVVVIIVSTTRPTSRLHYQTHYNNLTNIKIMGQVKVAPTSLKNEKIAVKEYKEIQVTNYTIKHSW